MGYLLALTLRQGYSSKLVVGARGWRCKLPARHFGGAQTTPRVVAVFVRDYPPTTQPFRRIAAAASHSRAVMSSNSTPPVPAEAYLKLENQDEGQVESDRPAKSQRRSPSTPAWAIENTDTNISTKPRPEDTRAQQGVASFRATSESVVPPAENGPTPLVQAVLQAFPDVFDTVSSARKAVRRGEIQVDGTRRKADFKVQGGELLQRWQRVASACQMCQSDVPEHLTMPVLWESDTWAVVAKPEGIPTVEPSEPGGWTAERMLPYFLKATIAPGSIWRPRTVHRLDSATSGILCCGKTRGALKALSNSFAQRLTTKRYRAIIVGKLEEEEGVIQEPLKDSTGKMQEAETNFRVVTTCASRSWGWLTTVDLWPRTGRTHQLRRHMLMLGHPILGDRRYGKAEHQADGQGLFLSAVELTIPNPDLPEGSAPLNVHSPEPDKFERIRQLESTTGAADARTQVP